MILDHESRKSRIGASEVAAILGHNENMSPLDVWLVKTGRKPHFEGNEHTRRGNRQEAQILEWLAEDLGLEIITNCPTLHHPGGLAAATPDGLIYKLDRNPFESGETLMLFRDIAKPELAEAKSTLKTIRSEDEIPLTWLIQCQWQMLCTRLKKCHLAIFGPMVSNYQRFEINYNEPLALELLRQAEEWWQIHIVGDKMPDPISDADARFLWPTDDGSTIEASQPLYEAIAQYRDLKEFEKQNTKRLEALRQRIVLAIGGAKSVRYAGQFIASYSTDKRGQRSLRT
jgi:putative phage-type endonuclease